MKKYLIYTSIIHLIKMKQHTKFTFCGQDKCEIKIKDTNGSHLYLFCGNCRNKFLVDTQGQSITFKDAYACYYRSIQHHLKKLQEQIHSF